jgi:hypothetical protein
MRDSANLLLLLSDLLSERQFAEEREDVPPLSFQPLFRVVADLPVEMDVEGPARPTLPDHKLTATELHSVLTRYGNSCLVEAVRE